MAYLAVKEGTNYAIYKDGQRISTVSESGLGNFGLSPTQLESTAQATTAIGTQVTQQAATQLPATSAPPPAATATASPTNTATPVGAGGVIANPKGVADLYQSYSLPAGFDLTKLPKNSEGEYSGYVIIGGKTYRVNGTSYSATLLDVVGGESTQGAVNLDGAVQEAAAVSQGVVPQSPEDTAAAIAGIYASYPNMTPDQKSAIEAIYGAIATKDVALYERAIAAFNAAKEFSDPYFKAQINLAKDALDRSFSDRDDDVEYRSQQLRNSLADLRNDVASSKEFMSQNQLDDLKNLETNYNETLLTTRDSLAARGFSSSSVRSRKEDLLQENFQGTVQSSNRAFDYKQNQLDQQVQRGQRDTTEQLARLQEIAKSGNLDTLRAAEAEVGSSNLGGYADILGGITGSIPFDELQSNLSSTAASLAA